MYPVFEISATWFSFQEKMDPYCLRLSDIGLTLCSLLILVLLFCKGALWPFWVYNLVEPYISGTHILSLILKTLSCSKIASIASPFNTFVSTNAQLPSSNCQAFHHTENDWVSCKSSTELQNNESHRATSPKFEIHTSICSSYVIIAKSPCWQPYNSIHQLPYFRCAILIEQPAYSRKNKLSVFLSEAYW